MMGKTDQNVALVLGASGDIGLALCERLLDEGWHVVAAARDLNRLSGMKPAEKFLAIECDLDCTTSMSQTAERCKDTGLRWNLFVSCAGTMEPIGAFFDTDFDSWEASVTVNSTAQLRMLHNLWPLRRAGNVDAMLMAGGGTNNPFTNYSAYCASKIFLIKMCELLDDEEEDLNIFIIGPGFVRTRIHEETLKAGALSGEGLEKTRQFLQTQGTSMDDIYENMKWCMAEGKNTAGGRNFSTVHDPWREGGSELAKALFRDMDIFRLRRKALPTGEQE